MKWNFDKEQEKNCIFFFSDDSSRLTLSPLLIIFCVCVSVCVACTDTELHSLAARLKDWFGVLHLDANRDLKSSDSFDSTIGREYIPHNMCVCVCVQLFPVEPPRFPGLRRAGGDVDSDPPLFSVMSTSEHVSALPSHTHRYSTHSVLVKKKTCKWCRPLFQICSPLWFSSSQFSTRLWHQHLAHL